MAELFGTQRPAITKHLRNIYQSGELQKQSTCSIMEHMPDRGRSYKTTLYNLDAITSVGYRVNSTRATQFRQWATRTLKQHLAEGYTLNQRRLQERGIELRRDARAPRLFVVFHVFLTSTPIPHFRDLA